MNPDARDKLIASLVASLTPVALGLLSGAVTPESAKVDAYAAVDDFIVDLLALRQRVKEDDAEAVADAVVGKTA